MARGHQDDKGRLPRRRVPRLGDDLHRDRPVREAARQELRAAPRCSDLHPTLGGTAARHQELLQRLAGRKTARAQQGYKSSKFVLPMILLIDIHNSLTP